MMKVMSYLINLCLCLLDQGRSKSCSYKRELISVVVRSSVGSEELEQQKQQQQQHAMMSDLTWEKYREEDLELSEKEFYDLRPIERANLKNTWREEVRKQQEHEARMRQLQQEEQANGKKSFIFGSFVYC